MTESRAVLDRAFETSDIIEVMSNPAGRRSIAMILELCMYEEDAMASNATAIAANVSKQEVALRIKNTVWNGGGKALWRRMEDEIELREDANETDDTDVDDDYDDLQNSLDDS